MVRATYVVCAAVVLCVPAIAQAQEPARSDGWVVIPVDEYRNLRLRAFPPQHPPAPPPVDAALTRVEYELRVNGDSAAGETRLTVDVMKEGWVRVDIPPGLLVRAARLDGRAVPLIDEPAPHVLLSKPGRAVLSLDVAVPLKLAAGSEAITLPASAGAVTRLALVVPRAGIDVTIGGGVLAERPAAQDAPWLAFGRAGQAMTVTWKKRADDGRAQQPLRWRGSVTQVAGLGEETSPITATVRMEIAQGLATAVEVTIPEGLVVNQVSGAMVADWDFRPGSLRVSFLEPVSSQTTFALSGEARTPRDGMVNVPLVRLPAADRETGGVAVEVLGAGQIAQREPRGLDPADPSDLGDALMGRDSPSMVAFRFRPQAGSAPRSLTLGLERFTPQAVLVANIEEARYDALLEEEGKTLVRARYAVRNNQRAFVALTLPAGAALWSAAVAGRPLRPGVSPEGALLLPLEKGRAGGDTPVFAIELTYVQRSAAWDEKGRASLVLPSLDLPVARTGIVLHHSPRFRVTLEPGPFRVEQDAGPFSAALRESDSAIGEGMPGGVVGGIVGGVPAAPTPPAAQTADAIKPGPLKEQARSPVDDLVRNFTKDSGGRSNTGPLPIYVPFPAFGPTLFVTSELTAELQAPSVELTYKRESRW